MKAQSQIIPKAELKRKIKRRYRVKDPHKEIYNKEYQEVAYKHMCPVCGNMMDENGMCACGAGGS